MQKRYSDRFVFGIDLGFAAVAVMLVTITFIAAEAYATNNHMMVDADLATFNTPVQFATAE